MLPKTYKTVVKCRVKSMCDVYLPHKHALKKIQDDCFMFVGDFNVRIGYVHVNACTSNMHVAVHVWKGTCMVGKRLRSDENAQFPVFVIL